MARPGLTGHRKFKRLARALGSPLVARGALELLWEACYECGDEYVGTAEDIEATVGWTGEPGALATALVEAGQPEGHGFIEVVTRCDNGATTYKVHDLWHHAPDYVAKRHKREMARQQRVAPSAKRRRTAPNGGQRPPSRARQTGVDRTPAPSPAPSPAPAPSHGEEISSAPPAATEPAADSPILLTFPTIGTDGESWRLRRVQVDEWMALYPGLDVLAECRKALAWVSVNPGKRKTVRGMPKFLVAWLTRSVDSGRGARLPPESQPSPEPVEDWSDECQRLHGRRCNGRIAHDTQMYLDAERAKRERATA